MLALADDALWLQLRINRPTISPNNKHIIVLRFQSNNSMSPSSEVRSRCVS